MPDKLTIADGTVLVIRPWFAGAPSPWRSAVGQLVALRRESTHLAVVMDITLDTFRRELAPSYKHNREPAPPDLITHFDRFREEAEKQGMPVLFSARHEADDCSATLVRLARAAGLGVALISDDKDLFQLVDDDLPVRVEDRHRDKVYDRQAVVAKLGVEPGQIVDYLSLVGDASDGVSGVAGVGATTAAALLQHFGSLDALYADLGAVASMKLRGAAKLAEKLEAGRATAMLARELVRLRDDVPMPADVLERARR